MRSVRTGMLAVTLAVAVVAIAVTAWVTYVTTREDVRADVEAEEETRQIIYEELSFYASTHPDWTGVDQLLVELSQRYGERVALTTLDGQLIADSDPGAELPQNPISFIDPTSPVIAFGELTGPDIVVRVESLDEQLDRLAEALTDAGIRFEVRRDSFGLAFPFWDEADPVAETIVSEVLAALAEESPLLAEMQREELPFFGPEDGFRFPSFTAEPALLFLGVVGQDDDPGGAFGLGLVVVLLAVAALAVVVSVYASRRLLGPVGSLTAAATELGAGDLSQRVPEKGPQEVVDLAAAFNSMAAQLQRDEELRRTLTTDVAHELRTPLANLRGYLEAAAEGVAELTPELVDSLHDETLLLQQLVEDLQDLSRAESGVLTLNRATADLGELTEQVVRSHQAGAASAGVTLRVDATSVTADVDERRIRQVIGNLVTNALRHTPQGGEVAVAVIATAGCAEVRVSDTGEGIPAEHLPHVFDRFYRADPSRSRDTGGSGLGLAIARELVTGHGGTIDVASVEGEGTVFSVRLPAATPSA